MMDNLTQPDADLAHKIKSTVPGMAHWAGSGPAGAKCGGCAWFKSVTRGLGASTRCEKYSRMMDGRVGAKKLPPDTPACKYFEAKSSEQITGQ
jgi:hypothetical protein